MISAEEFNIQHIIYVMIKVFIWSGMLTVILLSMVLLGLLLQNSPLL